MLGCDTQPGVGGGGKEEQFKWEHLADAWPLIKYASRLVYIMFLIICMIVVRKFNKKFVHCDVSQ